MSISLCIIVSCMAFCSGFFLSVLLRYRRKQSKAKRHIVVGNTKRLSIGESVWNTRTLQKYKVVSLDSENQFTVEEV